jgi:hypothetical protein
VGGGQRADAIAHAGMGTDCRTRVRRLVDDSPDGVSGERDLLSWKHLSGRADAVIFIQKSGVLRYSFHSMCA